MKVFISEDEWWPYYSIEKDSCYGYNHEREVSDEFFEEYKCVSKRFHEMHSHLRDLYDKE